MSRALAPLARRVVTRVQTLVPVRGIFVSTRALIWFALPLHATEHIHTLQLPNLMWFGQVRLMATITTTPTSRTRTL